MKKITKASKSLAKINDIKMDKISVFFKRSILNSILKILTMEHSGFRNYKALKNINRLFQYIDLNKYKSSKELESYIWCIRFISTNWLEGLVDIDLIIEKAKRSDEFDSVKEQLITSCRNDVNIISSPEAKMIFDLVSEALQFGYVSSMREEYLTLLDDIDLDNPAAFREVVNRLFMISQSLLEIKHNTNLMTNKITFNTADSDSVQEAITQTISSLSTSNNVFKVGIRRLNTLLSPGYMNGRIYVYLGLPGAGKAQPDDTLLPTPNGFKRMDELVVGDEVFNLYGKPTKVTGIYPQGVQETYKVTMTDGRSTRCNAEHLWHVLVEDKPVVLTLEDIMKDYKSSESDLKYVLPNQGPCEFNENELEFDPWMIGYAIRNKIINHIPKEYIYNSKMVRIDILRGIFGITDNGEFSSPELMKDICDVIGSLGIPYRLDGLKIQVLEDQVVRIANIEKVEDTEQRCITVDDPLHVYLTEQFIPTHNSLMLLKSVLDIRKYNSDYKPKTPGMKPCILYITMENSFTETIERIWNMTFDDSIVNYSQEEAMEKISKELGIGETGEDASSIEIVIKYFPYREISTDDLFTIIQDLKDENMEVCALVLDYIKRIRPSVAVEDNVKLELDRIMNELKALAIMKDIPVITAHQMNRVAATTVDTAARSGRGDVTKLVGREHVGSAFEVVEASDWLAVLNIEYKPGTDDRYLIVNVVKRRRIDSADSDFAKYTYLAHPFGKGLRLIDDMHLDKVLSLQSLVSDIDIVGKEKTNAVPRLKSMAANPFVEFEDDELI